MSVKTAPAASKYNQNRIAENGFKMLEKWLVSMIKKLQTTIFAISLVLFVFALPCLGDTFKHRLTGELLHGYATGQSEGRKTIVYTQEKGLVQLNPAKWQVTADRLGRNNKVVVLTLDGPIMHEIETAALEQAMAEILYEGPLFILLQIDTPGGRTDFAQRICGAIAGTSSCPVIAFVRGGEYGGAISAGAALALACDKIYMAGNTIIGAATTIAVTETGRPQALKRSYGEEVAEKFSSAWRAYLASLAEQNHRPGPVARAMVDKDMEVIEVTEAGKRLFIDPVNKRPGQKLVRTWSKKDSLLTLTAEEAAECSIADKVVSSQQQVLRDLDAIDAEIVINNCFQKAGLELRRAKGQFNRIRKSIDLKVKQSEHRMPVPKVLNLLRSAKSEYKTLIRLAKKYPDLGLDIKALEDELNSIEANYQKVRMDARRK